MDGKMSLLQKSQVTFITLNNEFISLNNPIKEFFITFVPFLHVNIFDTLSCKFSVTEIAFEDGLVPRMFLLHMSLQLMFHHLHIADLACDSHLVPVRLDPVLVEEVPGEEPRDLGTQVTPVNKVGDREELPLQSLLVILIRI